MNEWKYAAECQRKHCDHICKHQLCRVTVYQGTWKQNKWYSDILEKSNAYGNLRHKVSLNWKEPSQVAASLQQQEGNKAYEIKTGKKEKM